MSGKGWVPYAVFCALVVVLVAVLRFSGALQVVMHPPVITVPPPVASAGYVPPPTREQLEGFLGRVRQAETITDPLQRCLSYPDPPNSRWRPEVVAAYCRFYTQPTLSFDDVRQLIRSGHAKQLDQRLEQALQAQITQPDARGRLDRIFQNAFENPSADARATLDAWKQADPDSAFAYAASGDAYASMAAEARGGDFIQNTPEAALVAMTHLAEKAEVDLRHAIALDPRLTPAYGTMMDIARMAFGRDKALAAEAAGLLQSPGDYYLYFSAIILAEPKWGGSIDELNALARQAREHAARYPLLSLAANDAASRTFNFYNCGCDHPTSLAQIESALLHASNVPMLESAGHTMGRAGRQDLAVVYTSEAIRFADSPLDRLDRAYQLAKLGHPAWAHQQFEALLPELPGRGDVYRGLGFADIKLRQDDRAVGELQQAVQLDRTDIWSQATLGEIYARQKKWGQAWAIADQLIQEKPDMPDGWCLRADVQMGQPRAGLADTEQAFAQRFGNRPDQQGELRRIRDALAHGAR